MSTLNTFLDINASPRKILMDAVNYENRTSYVEDDFVFGTPEPYVLDTIPMTRILLTPKVGSPYYNGRHFYYKRMDLAGIYATRFIELSTEGKASLSELIPQINEFYGIALTADDYIEQALPVFDPLNPQPATVALQAKAGSLLFEGVAILKLNETAPAEDNDGYDRKVFMIVDNEDTSIWVNTLLCVSADDKVSETFQAFRNASAIQSMSFSDVQVLPNKNLLVKGNFSFTANLNGTSQAYTETKAILAPSGDVIAAGAMFGPATITDLAWSNHSNDVYVIDHANIIDPTSVNSVHKFSVSGLRETTWSITGLSYKPDLIRVDHKGRIYTVSAPYNDPNQKIRVDRFLADGTTDAAFTPIFLSMTDDSTPFKVNNITFDNMDDFFIGLNPRIAVTSIGATVAINGTGVIPGGQSQVYGYLPVFKFKENGSLDTGFKWEQKDFMYDVVIDHSAGVFDYATNTVHSTIQGITFLTYADNWVTGVSSARPVSYDVLGAPVLLSGKDHFDMPYWNVSVNTLLACKNGRSYMYGEASFRNPAGGERVTKNVLVAYRSDSSFEKIVYTTPTVAGPALKVTKACLYEFPY